MKQTAKNRTFHLRRAGLFATIILAFFVVKLDTGKLPSPIRPPYVLAYATDMSREGLLSSSNATRAAQGLGALTSDSQLNTSAQAKAQDMLNKDYWAHVAPDGTEPWYFFNQAGYSYSRASENLAYGFMSSQAVIDGWMNSASHRDNLLGQYNDVGFGIVNIPNYQGGGEQTLVVAHYGVRSAPAPSPAAPVVASTTSSRPPTTAPADAQSAQAADTATPQAATQNTTTAESKTNEEPRTTTFVTPVQTAAPLRISVLGKLGNGSLSVVTILALATIGLSAIGYAFTHRRAFQHALASGEHFVAAHPGMDAIVIAAITTLILTTTYGTVG